MSSAFCQDCTKRDTCKEICKPLKRYLSSNKSDKEILNIDRPYSDRWRRNKEVSYDPNILERKAGERATRILLGMSENSDMSVTENGDDE